jgi:hypothetical protein
LRLTEHVTNLYLHEIALHQNQGSADLQPPYGPETLSPPLSVGTKKDAPIGPAQVGALSDCLLATHGILDTILNIELDTLLTLPVIFCMLYSLSHWYITDFVRRTSYIRHRLSYEDVGVGNKF